MVNEKALIDVRLNSQEAEHQLQELQGEMKRLIELKHKAEEAGDVAGWKKIDGELKKVSRSATKLINDHRSLEQTLKNLNGASLKELREAQRALTSQTEKLNRETKEYIEKSKQLKLVNAEISKVNAQYRSQSSFIGRAAEGFNRYFAIATAAIASFTGVIIGVRKAIDTFNEFEERLDNLSALTGLAGDDLKWLADKADELSVSMLEGGIRVTQNATQIVDAFTKTGSARPELLKNKQALAETTQEAIILANAAKSELQPAIEALTMVMNQYNVPATEARRIINSLAAGSKEGAGEIPYLTTAFEKSGTVAADAGISIETLVATIETLAPRITQPEIAGRSLKGVILDLQTTSDDTNPAVVGLTTALDNLGKKNLSTTQLVKLFGTENITTAKILIDNVAELKRYEAAVTGTNVAIEQATINTGNNNSALATARNRLNLISKDLGEKLSPAYANIMGKTSTFLHIVTTLVDFVTKYGKILLAATSGVISLTIAVHAATIKTAAYTAATSAATIVTKAFNAVIKTNPVMLLVSVLTTAASAFFLFRNKVTEAKTAQSEFNEVVRQGNDLLGQKKTLEERAAVMKNLSKEQLSSLKTDLENQVRAEEDYHAVLLQKQKKVLTEDAELNRVNELRKQKDITAIQKVTLASKANARATEITRELDAENKANQQRLKNLKKTLGEVSNEFKNRPVDKPEGSGTESGNINNTAQNAFELAYKQQLLALKTYYADKQHLQEEAHARELALELAHLQALAELETDEGKRIDLKIRITDAQVKYNDALAKAIPEIISNEKQGDKLGTRLLETAKLTDYASQKQYEGVTATEAYTAKQQQQAQTIQMIGGVMTDYITSALNGQVDSFESFGQTLVLMSLQVLKQMVPIWSAQILGLSLSSPESVATWGVAGMAKYAAITALMYAGIAAVEGVVNRNIDKKREASNTSKGYYSGGWTGYGPETEVAGVVHKKEYVINAETVRNPMALPYIKKIDAIQQGSATTDSSGAVVTNAGLDLRVLSDLATEIRELRKWRPPVDLQTFESKWKEYNDIKQKRNL